MADKEFYIRSFEFHDNHASPYNPAALYDIDFETDHPPAVGDFIGSADEVKLYVVKERFFQIGKNNSIVKCALIVEATDRSMPEG